MSDYPPVLALTQGDPAGIGPEILLETAATCDRERWTPLLVAERGGIDALGDSPALDRLLYFDAPPSAEMLTGLGERIPVLDPVGEARQVVAGESGPADAAGAIAALDVLKY